MKRILSVVLSLFVLAGLFSFAGCKREKETDLSDGLHLVYDKSIAKLDKNTLENKDGHWRIVIHPCTSQKDLASRRSYFNNTLSSIANTNVVSEEKTFGEVTYQTEYHTSGGKFAGSYFTVLDQKVETNDILHPLYGIYCYVTAKDESFVPEIEKAISGLYIRSITK